MRKIKDLVPAMFSALHIFADPKCQERVWKERLGPETHTYLDVLEDFFQSFESLLPLEEKRTLSHAQRDALLHFAECLERFHETVGDKEMRDISLVLNHPQWKDIQNKARSLLELFEEDD
ncbi:MAG: hypothetical protein KDK71_05310 [Chlamydiia bacterium]|nr:hypothetical protein [Chlamydiia bacterium]